MNKLNDILAFVKHISSIDNLEPESDIFKCGVGGDDFHEMIEEYAEKYEVDMKEYLWYFHSDEEGVSPGALFFKPPYARVERIPVTPKLLFEFAKEKRWNIQYPTHKLPNQRIDIIINQIFVIVCILIIVVVCVSYLYSLIF